MRLRVVVWLALSGALCVTACRDHVDVVFRHPVDAATPSPADGAGTGDVDAAASDTSGTTGTAGAPSGASGGPADAADDIDTSAAADAEAACTMDRDCPRPPTVCAVARCSHGFCAAANAPAGALVPDVPGDCHDVMCDGRGGVSARPLDENNVPVFENPCLAGTCDEVGVPGVEPLTVGALCHLAGGAKVCDGAGRCVQCLLQSDCAAGLYCQKDHSCGTTPCTDVACGGGCTPCGVGGKCLASFDCLSSACDAASLTCVADRCADHRVDGNETDVDCGGGAPCARCAIGAKCQVYYDCETGYCDALLHQCVSASDGCTDHAIDGDETDVDCGGPLCAPCASNKFCKVPTDCQSGLHCSGSPLFCN